MGHKDISVTLNTYTSVFNRYKESEMEKVNDYYLENNFFDSQNQLSDSSEPIIINKDDYENDLEKNEVKTNDERDI